MLFCRGYLPINYTCFDFVSQFRGLKRCVKNPKVFWDFADKESDGLVALKGHKHEKNQQYCSSGPHLSCGSVG